MEQKFRRPPEDDIGSFLKAMGIGIAVMAVCCKIISHVEKKLKQKDE